MIRTNKGAPSIAVIGGGMAGLECALTAAQRGCRVEIIEVGPSTRTRHMNWDMRTYPGDEKTRSWSGEGWGPGGGLSERLGGRSLCYHGVLLELDRPALADWDPVWRDRLCCEEGLYASVLERLRPDYPELSPNGHTGSVGSLGLKHVPQAARLAPSGLFEAYSPLMDIISGLEAGRITLTRARALAVHAVGESLTVELESEGQRTKRSGFDACILAASAIGNVQILARSLDRDIWTKITDHFCIGAFVRLPPGAPLATFRHPMLWSGFAESADIGANTFVLERQHLANGDRLIEIMAVAEQQGGAEAYSDLSVTHNDTRTLRTHIHARVSNQDKARLECIGQEVQRWAETLAGCDLKAIGPRLEPPSAARSGKHAGSDPRWFGHDAALAAVEASDRANVFSRFELPYGAFEHEACTHPIAGKALAVSCDLEVSELPGVYVAGPGIFPRLGVANPALTILATSQWLGGHIANGGTA